MKTWKNAHYNFSKAKVLELVVVRLTAQNQKIYIS